MGTFPLPTVPAQTFQSGALVFGNNRGKVEHAACDLVAPPGTPVLAVEDGLSGTRRASFSKANLTTMATESGHTNSRLFINSSLLATARYARIRRTAYM